jgi:hypothetical protein
MIRAENLPKKMMRIAWNIEGLSPKQAVDRFEIHLLDAHNQGARKIILRFESLTATHRAAFDLLEHTLIGAGYRVSRRDELHRFSCDPQTTFLRIEW